MKILKNVFGFVMFFGIIGLLTYALSKEKTTAEKTQDLINKGYNQHQADSIIRKQNDEMTTAILNLAG